MQGITEVGTGINQSASVISAEELKAFLYLTIRGGNQLATAIKADEKAVMDTEHGVDVKA